ncbi:hypothetical protein [Armatimonas sp.]|uniref:hypothetical protein n=1 Tax=Armatimonas sp. TaxID=1872638 RepID=UPI003751257F
MMTKRIAFGWNGTLLPEVAEFRCDHPQGVQALLLSHGLRCGALGLMRSLQRDGWEIWIYTLADLPTRRVRLFFALNGIQLGGIVTGQEHRSAVRAGRAPVATLKHAPAFGLTLIADDKEATAQAGRRYGFETLMVTTCHKDWTALIRERCLEASQGKDSLAVAA